MKAIEMLKTYVMLGVCQEDAQDPTHADRTINCMTNVELLEALEDAADWVDSLSPEELQALEE